jgi:hypothetical protein
MPFFSKTQEIGEYPVQTGCKSEDDGDVSYDSGFHSGGLLKPGAN